LINQSPAYTLAQDSSSIYQSKEEVSIEHTRTALTKRHNLHSQNTVMTNATAQSVTRTSADLKKLDLFSSLWGMFLHKQMNPHEFMVTAIE